MSFLDTHVVMWLYKKAFDQFSSTARTMLDDHELFISPIVLLELQYLYESRRIAPQSIEVLHELEETAGLRVADDDWEQVIRITLDLSWTRDPFDRCIVAHAKLRDAPVITKDHAILEHYEHAVW